MKHEMFDKAFEPTAAFDAEGVRIGVATCKTCGAAVVIDLRDTINYLRKHYEWHKERNEVE